MARTGNIVTGAVRLKVATPAHFFLQYSLAIYRRYHSTWQFWPSENLSGENACNGWPTWAAAAVGGAQTRHGCEALRMDDGGVVLSQRGDYMDASCRIALTGAQGPPPTTVGGEDQRVVPCMV
jgi:hypothetical protein